MTEQSNKEDKSKSAALEAIVRKTARVRELRHELNTDKARLARALECLNVAEVFASAKGSLRIGDKCCWLPEPLHPRLLALLEDAAAMWESGCKTVCAKEGCDATPEEPASGVDASEPKQPLGLDAAIAHAEREATLRTGSCAAEHRLLANWLIELRNRREDDEERLREARAT